MKMVNGSRCPGFWGCADTLFLWGCENAGGRYKSDSKKITVVDAHVTCTYGVFKSLPVYLREVSVALDFLMIKKPSWSRDEVACFRRTPGSPRIQKANCTARTKQRKLRLYSNLTRTKKPRLFLEQTVGTSLRMWVMNPCTKNLIL